MSKSHRTYIAQPRRARSYSPFDKGITLEIRRINIVPETYHGYRITLLSNRIRELMRELEENFTKEIVIDKIVVLYDRSNHFYTIEMDVFLPRKTFTIERGFEHIRKKFEKFKNEKILLDYRIARPFKDLFLINPYVRKLVNPRGETVSIFAEHETEGIILQTLEEYGNMGKIILSKIGYQIGLKKAEVISSLSTDISLETAISVLLYMLQGNGLIYVSDYSVSKTKENINLHVIALESLEEEIYKKNGIKECSSFTIGIMEGFLEGLSRYLRTRFDYQIKQKKCLVSHGIIEYNFEISVI